MTEQEKAQSIEKANAYRQMMESWAWKDFEKNILDAKRLDALEAGISSSTMDAVQMERGKVKCVDAIKADLHFILAESM